MTTRFHADPLARALAAAAAVAVTSGMLAALHVEAGAGRPPVPVAAEFTGEVTANGPVYRLPTIVVRNRAGLFLALPTLIDGALAADTVGASQDGTPGA